MLLLLVSVVVFLGTFGFEEAPAQRDLYDKATSRVVFDAKGARSYWTTMGDYIHGDQDGSRIGDDWASELSSDGLTVVYGSPREGVDGGLRVRVYDGETWVIKGNAIYETESDSGFGHVNTISGDGDTIATGSEDFSEGDGKVWVYTWEAGVWEPKGTIDNTDSFGEVGKSVQLSNDGDSILVGMGDNPDTARSAVYDWDGTNWNRRGDWLVPPEGASSGSCGYSGSMARETTNTVLMYCDGPEKSFIFMWDGSAWVSAGTFEAPHGVTTDVEDEDYWGQQNALSDDGMYVMMSSYYMYDPAENNDHVSSSYHGGFQVLKWTGSNWIARGQIVFGSADDAEATYYGASMSRDGSTVCMSEDDPHYVVTCHMYDESKDMWVTKGMPLTITPETQRLDEDSIGHGMSLNNDGSILVFGSTEYDQTDMAGPGDNRGALFIFQWHEAFLTQRATKRVLQLQETLAGGVSEFKWNEIQLIVMRHICFDSERQVQDAAVTAFSAWYEITKSAYTMDNFNNLKTAVDAFVSTHGIGIVKPAATVWMYDDYRRRKM